ncbi:hypothetical protein ABDX87_09600 [Pseudomonas abietaniphila]|uniref:hypothetical protein n=1 Tax=Pseudomonas abietaniphila TaxID=89065 RepID=UPI003216A361
MRVALIWGLVFLVLLTALGCVIASKFICDMYVFYKCVAFSSFSSFYAVSLRGSLFAGFLTLGGFLMSLKTFIVVNMKKEVYDSAAYIKRFESLKMTKPSLSRYEPLQALSNVLFVTILSCLSTSVMQLTIGLFESFYASLLCLMFAAGSITLLAWTLYLIRANLQDMFEHLDDSK